MGSEPLAVRRRTNFPLLGVGALSIPLVVFGIVPRLTSTPPTGAESLSLALSQGLVPAAPHPGVGTKIYQWDPELANFPPHFVGQVTESDFHIRGGRYVLVFNERSRVKRLYLDIQPNGLRYWVRR